MPWRHISDTSAAIGMRTRLRSMSLCKESNRVNIYWAIFKQFSSMSLSDVMTVRRYKDLEFNNSYLNYGNDDVSILSVKEMS